MKWRVAIGAGVLAVVLAVVGCVVALAGGSTGHPAPRPITNPARHWLQRHAFLTRGQPAALDLTDVARTLLGLEPDFRKAHHAHLGRANFNDELVTQACTYVFGHTPRINRALKLHRFRFDIHASGPTVSPREPGGADHEGYALQCGYSHGPLGGRLVQLDMSSGGVTLHNLTTYVQARGDGVTFALAFAPRPRSLAARPRVHRYLAQRLARVAYPG